MNTYNISANRPAPKRLREYIFQQGSGVVLEKSGRPGGRSGCGGAMQKGDYFFGTMQHSAGGIID
jgi:hypothetical protein